MHQFTCTQQSHGEGYVSSFFFFQAEDGIRDHCVTGVQTCALPISYPLRKNMVLQLPLDTERFKWELQNHIFAQRVSEDAESGRHSRVSGTPTFFINGIRHDDTYTLDVLLPAVRSYENPYGNR